MLLHLVVEPIFLYNSELWSTNKTHEQNIDTFQRKLLRNILNISWRKGNWISNNQLYQKTKLKPWSELIKTRRLRLFGHLCRLPNETPAKIALEEALKPTKYPQGGRKTTLLRIIKKQLKQRDIVSIQEAVYIAQDRKTWRTLTST